MADTCILIPNNTESICHKRLLLSIGKQILKTERKTRTEFRQKSGRSRSCERGKFSGSLIIYSLKKIISLPYWAQQFMHQNISHDCYLLDIQVNPRLYRGRISADQIKDCPILIKNFNFMLFLTVLTDFSILFFRLSFIMRDFMRMKYFWFDN